MERIRKQLKIERWLLFGGSWGSTLTLLYAQKYTGYVLGMVIRGVFLARQKDLDWFAKEGAGRIYPEKWEQLLASVPEQSRTDLVKGLYEVLFGQRAWQQKRLNPQHSHSHYWQQLSYEKIHCDNADVEHFADLAYMQLIHLLGDFEQIKVLIDDAMKAGTERNIGHNYILDVDYRYSESARTIVETPWDVVNELIQGGLGAGELGVIVSPSGIGK
jgi:proline iminopeptidase